MEEGTEGPGAGKEVDATEQAENFSGTNGSVFPCLGLEKVEMRQLLPLTSLDTLVKARGGHQRIRFTKATGQDNLSGLMALRS